MRPGALLACWFISGQAQVPSKDIRKLEIERQAFFHKTCGLPDSGYTYGEEGSGHEIMFPTGRSDVLYYQSYTGRMGHPSTYTVTKWRAVGRTYKKVWHMSFHEATGGKPPTGTLLLRAFGRGYRPKHPPFTVANGKKGPGAGGAARGLQFW